MRALRAREVVWRHAGSTRNAVRSKVQAVAAEVQLAEKRGDAPLEEPNQRVHEGAVQLDLVAQVERDEGRLVVDVGRSGRRDRGTRFCVYPRDRTTDRTPGIEPAVLGIEPSGSNLGLELAARARGVMVRGGCWVGRLSRVLRG